jgi:predicted nucleic acid-binding protein
LTAFVDTSIWFAAMVARDRDSLRAKAILRDRGPFTTTDHVVVETWQLLNSRYKRDAAEEFWQAVRSGAVYVEFVTLADLEAAWSIGERFRDQDFSIVDRTSFAVMERLGITQVASFDRHFSVYRFGRNRERAFEVLR